ncbi:MAG: TonB-dependent receptor plug domain-containing protein [Novosphingobium sp.]|nr:TonB-dependent receptor plug domain-containing protein [Novosphingobium sp.]
MNKLSPKALLYTTVAPAILGAAMVSTPAFAADEPLPVLPVAAAVSAPAAGDGVIVVTGSRQRSASTNSSSPIDVLRREDRVLAGVSSIADLLQSASITSGTSQIDGAYLNFVGEGGPAANTIGLRGLGASRTLVLLNGRRLAPAGAGPKLIAADLNVLPTALIKRIDILKEGASSIYGSGAVAGVVNVITDTKFEGVTFDFFTKQPLEHGGGGRDYRASVTGGHVFDRGHITAAFEYRERTGLRVGDRPEFGCPRSLIFDPASGAEVGQIDASTGQLACFPYALDSGIGLASGYGIAQSLSTGAFSRLGYFNGDINQLQSADGLVTPSPSPVQQRNHVISPTQTYTGYLNGAYELGALGDAEIYAEGLFTRRESSQQRAYQLNVINPNQLSPNVELFGGFVPVPFPPFALPIGALGAPASPFFPNSVANDPRFFNVFLPFIVPDRPVERSQRIDYVRANGGLRGDLGIGDWRYDANFQYSHTKSRYSDLEIERSAEQCAPDHICASRNGCEFDYHRASRAGLWRPSSDLRVQCLGRTARFRRQLRTDQPLRSSGSVGRSDSG